MIGRSGILTTGLPVMASFAQRTPVAPIPEQFLITTVWDDVIHHSGFRVALVLPALLAQRM